MTYHEHLITDRVCGPCAGCGVYVRAGCHVTRRIVETGISPTSIPELWDVEHCPVCAGGAKLKKAVA